MQFNSQLILKTLTNVSSPIPVHPVSWEFGRWLSEEPPWPHSCYYSLCICKDLPGITPGKSKDPWRPVPVPLQVASIKCQGNTGIRTNMADICCNVPWEITIPQSSQPMPVGSPASLFPVDDVCTYFSRTHVFMQASLAFSVRSKGSRIC